MKMNSMTTEEKAKAYDEAIERAKNTIEVNQTIPDIVECVESLFPELKGGENEKIRKELIKFINDKVEQGSVNAEQFVKHNSWITWLEKQGEHKSADTDNKFIRMRETKPKDISEFLDRLTTVEQEFLWEHFEKVKKIDREEREQKPVIEMKTPEESLCIDSDTYNKIVDECVYGEQKPIDKVEPKFKIGDKIRRKTPSSCDKDMQVARIEKDYYVCNHIGKLSSEVVPFSKESSYELIEQKPIWSEEDENGLNDALWCCKQAASIAKDENDMGNAWYAEHWLKSLKERYTWKPSDEQMVAVQEAMNIVGILTITGSKINSLYQDLKKLREE